MANGELPDGWDVAPIGSLCIRTETVNPAREPKATFEYIDVSAISNKSWSIIGSTPYQGSQAPSRARKRVREGDVIFATVRPTLKRVAHVPADRDGQVASTAFCVLRAVPEKIEPRFLYFSLLTEDFTARMENIQRGASYPAVSDSDVMEQAINLPPLPEQRAIAAVLSKLQRAAEAQDKIIATLKGLKAATLAKLFREGLRGEPLKETEIGEVPQSWEVVPAREAFSIKQGQVDPRREPYASMMHIGPEDVEPESGRLLHRRTAESLKLISGKYLFQAGDVVYSKIRPYLQKAVLANEPGICSADMYPLTAREGFAPQYLRTILLSAAFTDQTVSHQDRTGIPKVNREQLNMILVPKPPMEEQIQIGTAITVLMARELSAHHAYEASRFAFQSMLHLLMTGEIRTLPSKQWTELDGR